MMIKESSPIPIHCLSGRSRSKGSAVSFCFFLSLFLTLSGIQRSSAFLISTRPVVRSAKSSLHYKEGNEQAEPFDASENRILQSRLFDLKVQAMEEEFRRPPNPNLSAKTFVAEIINSLQNNGDPLPDSGFRTLLRSSTAGWKQQLYRSVGAPRAANQEVVASALGEAMAREKNQFAILVDSDASYEVSFPTDTLDYGDGTAWIECRLRKEDGELLVVTGWQLERRAMDGSWMVDQIDWQDFRDEFRPGIGREEWMRICG